MKAIWIAFAAVMATSAGAQDFEEERAMEAGIIRLSAQMNELALACRHMTAKDVETGRIKQRTETIKSMEVAAADYDKLYAKYKADFLKKWNSEPGRQAQTCAHMKNQGR